MSFQACEGGALAASGRKLFGPSGPLMGGQLFTADAVRSHCSEAVFRAADRRTAEDTSPLEDGEAVIPTVSRHVDF